MKKQSSKKQKAKSRSSVAFDAVIDKFGKQGEKTGWTYILIPGSIADKLNPGFRKAYRVKGHIDDFVIRQAAIMPMGDGSFILPFNSSMRKSTGKKYGDMVTVSVTLDQSEIAMDKDLMTCLEEDLVAKKTFMSLPPSHRGYFSKWIAEAKTIETKTRRITLTLEALEHGMNFGEMLRAQKKLRES